MSDELRGPEPDRFDEDKREEFLRHVRNGMRRGAAAEALGLEQRDVVAYIQGDEHYEALVNDAEGEATEHVEEALYQAAVTGHVGACKLWLDLRSPAHRSAARSDDDEIAALLAALDD